MIRRARRSPVAHRAAAVALITVVATVAAVLLGVPQPADAASNNPVLGRLTIVTQSGNGMDVQGWAYDPDRTDPVTVRITIDGHLAAHVFADRFSPNIAKAHPAWGNHRRFQLDMDEPAGQHTVCADARDYPTTTRVSFGCSALTLNYDPFGAVESVRGTAGHLTLTGWAIDPNDETRPLGIGTRVDGKVVGTTTANDDRPDIAGQYPAAGAAHGFALTVPIAEGTHQVCVRAQNIGLGTAPTVPLLCVDRRVNYSPSGVVRSVTQQANGRVRIIGSAWDPDTKAPITVRILSGRTVLGTAAAKGTSDHPLHGFDLTYALPRSQWTPGIRRLCVVGVNAGSYGTSRTVACRSAALDYNPEQALQTATQQSPGVRVTGWAVDPDTDNPIRVAIRVDGTVVKTVSAARNNANRAGHGFVAVVPAANGRHQICASGVNTLAGTGATSPACRTVTLNFNPVGRFERLRRASSAGPVRVTGWAYDPDRTAPIPVKVTVDGGAPRVVTADVVRRDVSAAHPGVGAAHGFDATVPATDGEHRVCVFAVNVGGGTGDRALGCKVVYAVHATAPTAPGNVVATAGYGGAVVTWAKPASDGGAPWTKYTITAFPGGRSVTAGAGDTSATVYGLASSTTYTFTVTATNVAGTSAAGTSNAATTRAQPPAQNTPAPISTSRYVRNISSASSSDTAKLYREGQADAAANPSGHGYLVLLDIGGQDEARGGVILSASIKFVTYPALVANMKSYLDGYASRQKASAPVTVAVGTNNDVDVTRTAGAHWADYVVDPLVAYARKYPGITVTGANDIEPGFTAGYNATKAWLTGYLGATKAPFVFNGSADGCSGYGTGSGCNNGWSAARLFDLAGGAAPTRIINLPQIYNTTMARQWRYISLTGVTMGRPRINFGGALTEWTACQQAGTCGSLTGTSAWTEMWNQLRAEPALKINSLPYSTDLRIDW